MPMFFAAYPGLVNTLNSITVCNVAGIDADNIEILNLHICTYPAVGSLV